MDISLIHAQSILKIIVSFFLSGIGAYAYLSYAQMLQNMCNQLKQQVYSHKKKKPKTASA